MDKLVLTKEWNCDHRDVVALPHPFTVDVTFDSDRGFVAVNFAKSKEYFGEEPLYTLDLFVPDEYQDLAEYLSDHSPFTNFTQKLVRYITDDLIHYMRTGYYYDDDETAHLDFEPYESFSLDYYEDRWEEFLLDFLKDPQRHYSSSNDAEDQACKIKMEVEDVNV